MRRDGSVWSGDDDALSNASEVALCRDALEVAMSAGQKEKVDDRCQINVDGLPQDG